MNLSYSTSTMKKANENTSDLKISKIFSGESNGLDVQQRKDVIIPKECLEHILHCATLAPSADNNQPWRFQVSESGIDIYLANERAIASDTEHILDYTAIGMAVENIRLACGYYNIDPSITINKIEVNPASPLVSIRFQNGGKTDPNYHYIPLRHTDRGLYSSRPLPEDFLQEINELNNESDVLVKHVGKSGIRKIASHIAALERIRLLSEECHKELFSSLRFTKKEFHATRTGLFSKDLKLPWMATLSLPLLKSRTLLKIMDKLQLLTILAFQVKKQVLSSQGAILITVKKDSADAYLKAGGIAERLWLTASRYGLSVQPFGSISVFSRLSLVNKFYERKKTIQQISHHIKSVLEQFDAGSEGHQVIMFRVGYGDSQPSAKVRLALQTMVSYEKPVNPPVRKKAFVRNLGLTSTSEMETLANATIAVPGLGGVGGSHLVTLARMGIGGFHIADQDTFSIANLNRQYGATHSTLGKNKAEVMERIVKDINPELRLKTWNSMITENNVTAFLTGCQLVVDSLDAYAIDARKLLYDTAQKMGIPVIAAGPLGFGTGMLIFTPQSMSFDEYFDTTSDLSFEEKFKKFIVGTAPRPSFLRYMDTNYVNMKEQYGPSSMIGINLCAAMAATECIRYILEKGPLKAVPHYHYFDPFLGKYKVGYIPLGNKNPLQKLKYYILSKKIKGSPTKDK